jgi:glucokinase
MKVIFGLDVGGTNIKSVAATSDGQVVARRSDATPRGGSVKQAVQNSIEHLEKAVGPPKAIGIAVPGLISPDRLTLADLPRDGQDLAGVNWQKFLDFHRPIPMINDAQAALLGERWLGAARGLDHVIMLTLGTGVGGAAICDGRLLRGWLGRAGAIGLTSLDAFGPECPYGCPGALEDFVSNGSLSARSDGRFKTTVELLRAVDDGDQQAAEVWERSVRALAAGIASAINMLDPQRVILGGGIAQAGDRLFVPLQQWLDRFEWQALPNRRVEIAPAELGDSAGPLGAIRLAEDFAGKTLAIG